MLKFINVFSYDFHKYDLNLYKNYNTYKKLSHKTFIIYQYKIFFTKYIFNIIINY